MTIYDTLLFIIITTAGDVTASDLIFLDHSFRLNVDSRWVYQRLYKEAAVDGKECASTSSMSILIERSGIYFRLIPVMSFTKRLKP